MSLRTATDHLRVAHALRNLPRITEAFAAGRISYSKVRALTRITGSDTATLTRIAAAIAAAPAALTGNTASLIEMHTRARLRIERSTLTPNWYGECLDPEPILDALLPRRVPTAAA